MRKQVGQASIFADRGLQHEIHALMALPQIGKQDRKIFAGVPPHECKVKINLSRLLALTSGPASSRAW